MSKLKPLSRQTIVLTGASSGIGLCTAQLAAQEGARLVLVARSAQVLESLARLINASGGEAIALAADVSDRGQVMDVARAAVARFGRIDCWINNAGISMYGRLDEVSEDDSRRLFDVNFWGVVNGSLAALPHLRESGGALINVGSEQSESIVPLQGMTTSSKHAIKGFTDTLRVEVQEVDKAPVSITLIQPAAVNTPLPQHARNYMDSEPKPPTPAIEPQDVARAILKAAVGGGRDVKVGLLAKLRIAVSKLLPALGDKLSARMAGRQQKDLPPQRPDGALWEPSRSGRIHGPVH